MITDVALGNLFLVRHLSFRLLVFHQNSATIEPLDLIFTKIAKNIMVLEITGISYFQLHTFCDTTLRDVRSRNSATAEIPVQVYSLLSENLGAGCVSEFRIFRILGK